MLCLTEFAKANGIWSIIQIRLFDKNAGRD